MQVYVNKKQIPIMPPNDFAASILSSLLPHFSLMSHSMISTNFREFVSLLIDYTDEYIIMDENSMLSPAKKGALTRTKKKFQMWEIAMDEILDREQSIQWLYELILKIEGLAPAR